MTASALSNPMRPLLLAAARSPRIERSLVRLPLTQDIVTQFVAGTELDEVIRSAETILHSHRAVTIDHLGEDTTDRDRANETVTAYLELLDALGQAITMDVPGLTNGVEVSLKLSALGQALGSDGHAVALENARLICERAGQVGALVTIDAEDHTTTDSTLGIVRELRRDHPSLGAVLQAHLRRTESDCRELAGPGSRIRLCKGAYSEPRSVAFHGKREVDAAYLRCLEILMRGEGYPMVASHDPVIIARAASLAEETGRGADDVEYQMLYGVRDAEQRRLAAAGNAVRVYLPYGSQWFPYFMRRLAERPANVTFFLRALTAEHSRKDHH